MQVGTLFTTSAVTHIGHGRTGPHHIPLMHKRRTAVLIDSDNIARMLDGHSMTRFGGESREYHRAAIGGADGMTFIFKRSADDDTCFDHFSGIAMDGEALTKDRHYTASRGSTVITLKPELLEGLSVGEHKLIVIFDDAETEIRLIVKASANETKSPETGSVSVNGNGFVLWIGFAAVCAACFGTTYAIGKKKKIF